jgi:hypothetical protein
MNKKIITGISIIASIATFATILVASAQITTSTGAVLPVKAERPILEVDPEGKVLMRGTIVSVGSKSLTVNSWGGTWTVNVSPTTKVLPEATGNDLTNLKQGDFVGIQGTVSQSSQLTIDAVLIRDWTYHQTLNQERQQNIKSANALKKSMAPKNYVGTASNVSDNSFTLTINGVANTVNVAPGAKIVNRNWITIKLSDIKDGDNVRVWGTNDNGTITASIVRDVSIPKTSR